MRDLWQILLVLPALSLGFGCDGAGSGTGSEYSLTVEPLSIDFGYVEPLAFSGARDVEFQNDGGSTVSVQSIILAGENADAFLISEQPASLPESLASRESLTLKISFTPPGTGIYEADLEVTTDADDGPIIVRLGGCSTDIDCVVDLGDDDDSVSDDDDDDAVSDDDDTVADDDDTVADDDDDDVVSDGGQVYTSPASLDMGTVAQNQNPVSDVLTLSNVGNGPLTVDSVELADGAWFSVQGYSGGTLQAGSAPVNLQVSFDPTGAPLGTITDELVIESDSETDSTLSVPITVTVDETCPPPCAGQLFVQGAVTVDVVLAQVEYVEVGPGSPTVTIENIGSGPLTLGAITEGGTFCPDQPDAAYVAGAPTQLQAGETADLEMSITGTTTEVINFGGVYAFTFGTVPEADLLTWGFENCSPM